MTALREKMLAELRMRGYPASVMLCHLLGIKYDKVLIAGARISVQRRQVLREMGRDRARSAPKWHQNATKSQRCAGHREGEKALVVRAKAAVCQNAGDIPSCVPPAR